MREGRPLLGWGIQMATAVGCKLAWCIEGTARALMSLELGWGERVGGSVTGNKRAVSADHCKVFSLHSQREAYGRFCIQRRQGYIFILKRPP